MSTDQINLISNILKDLLKDGSDGKSEEIAKLIHAKLMQQQEEKAEAERKKWEEINKYFDPFKSCNGCYRPNPRCRCLTKY